MSFLKRNTDLIDAFKRTIEWNKIANNGQFDLSDQRKDLQHRCLLEELEELRVAIDKRNKEETVDAICDILFVAVYAYFMQDTSSIHDLGVDHDFVDLDYTLDDLYTQLHKLCENKRYYTMITLILQTSYLFDFSLKGAYEHVVMCNFSKFPLEEEINISEELEWFEVHSKYSNVVHTIVDGHCVFRQDNGLGKIVKPRCTKQPELTQFIGG